MPTVPLTAEVNFLDALEPGRSTRCPRVYNTNHTAVQIIKEEETLQLEAYELGGLWLIGYGHLMLEGEKDVITEEEADAFLVADLHWCEGAIERYVALPVTLNEFSAMVAFCYNVGIGQDARLVDREAGQQRRPAGRRERLPAVEPHERRRDAGAGQAARASERCS